LDVCGVVAGISGLSVAYTLARAGRSLAVIDDGMIGRGMTARTTAHVVSALDDRYYELEKVHGEEGARFAAESHTAAIAKSQRRTAAMMRTSRLQMDFLFAQHQSSSRPIHRSMLVISFIPSRRPTRRMSLAWLCREVR